MKKILKQSLKLSTMCVVVAVIFTLSENATQAQELTVDGSTLGSSFTPGGATNGGLSFSGTNFGGATSGGVLDLNNMGTLTINPSTVGTSDGIFTLSVAFRLPSGVTLNPVDISGQVFGFYTDAFNFALIDFVNTPSVVTFSGANGTGVFSLQVDDVCLDDGIPCSFGEIEISKLRRHKSLNALALNTAQRGDGNVKFVKAKGSASMFGPTQTTETFTITATITFDPSTFTPANVDQCKNDGWKAFVNPSFKNQGDCVSAFILAAK